MSNTSNYSNSILLNIFLLIISALLVPIILIGIYELIHFHMIIYGKDNPLMIALGCTILLFLPIAGIISKYITNPIKQLIEIINLYRLKRLNPKSIIFNRKDEFGYLFQEYQKMIEEIEKYQAEALKKARLVAIGETTAMIAHDVRKPLAGMKALLRMLPHIKENTEEANKIFYEIESGINRTNAMLERVPFEF